MRITLSVSRTQHTRTSHSHEQTISLVTMETRQRPGKLMRDSLSHTHTHTHIS